MFVYAHDNVGISIAETQLTPPPAFYLKPGVVAAAAQGAQWQIFLSCVTYDIYREVYPSIHTTPQLPVCQQGIWKNFTLTFSITGTPKELCNLIPYLPFVMKKGRTTLLGLCNVKEASLSSVKNGCGEFFEEWFCQDLFLISSYHSVQKLMIIMYNVLFLCVYMYNKIQSKFNTPFLSSLKDTSSKGTGNKLTYRHTDLF